MGADQKPSRRLSVDGEGCGGFDPGSFRPVEEAEANHADHGSVTADGSGLREDLTALLRASGRVRGQVCPSVVQAHAPRYGTARALSRLARAERRVDLAGSNSGGESFAGRRERCRRAQGEDSRLRPVGFAAGFDGVGIGLDVPPHRQARRCQRGAYSPQPAKRLGGQPAEAACGGAAKTRDDPDGVQRLRGWRQENLACRLNCSRRQCRGRKGG